MTSKRSAFLSAIFIVIPLILIVCFIFINISTHHQSSTSLQPRKQVSSGNRKLQVFAERFHVLTNSGTCTNRDISISQSRDTTSGIPRYIVQIVNTLVNPTSFKRLSYDDCFVNGGKPLMTGQIIRFTYLNSFMYPLSFKSARFC
ncbi:hypothetical protein QQ045_025944 [Rhodiola kirilowii]